MNVELVATDWGTVVQRRASRKPPAEGGWSIFHTWYSSASIYTPAINTTLRGQGNNGWFGWYENSNVETMAVDWLNARDDAQRAATADKIQVESFNQVPIVPLGQFYMLTAYRANLTGIVPGNYCYPWNVRRA
jgi:peptide/nickel transport system substrate-binding protein